MRNMLLTTILLPQMYDDEEQRGCDLVEIELRYLSFKGFNIPIMLYGLGFCPIFVAFLSQL
jgi:hypothetical protein